MTLKTTLGAMFIVCVLLSPQLFAGNEQNSFNGTIGTGNPCNASFVSLAGPVDVMVQTNTESPAPHVSVHLRFKADGSANNGDAYKMSFIASANFDAVSTQYNVPFHSVFVGKGTAPNFSASGNIRVFVNAAGKPLGAWITSLSSACTQ